MVSIIETITDAIVLWITTYGAYGIYAATLVENIIVPVPSEVILPFAGFTTGANPAAVLIMAAAASLGSLTGAVFIYALALYGGRPLVEKVGKYMLIKREDIDGADRWFAKHGSKAVFLCRLGPIARELISIPAGLARMDFKRFTVYSFTGSFVWSLFLIIVGVALGQNWHLIRPYFEILDYVALVAIVLVIGFLFWRSRRRSHHTST